MNEWMNGGNSRSMGKRGREIRSIELREEQVRNKEAKQYIKCPTTTPLI